MLMPPDRLEIKAGQRVRDRGPAFRMREDVDDDSRGLAQVTRFV